MKKIYIFITIGLCLISLFFTINTIYFDKESKSIMFSNKEYYLDEERKIDYEKIINNLKSKYNNEDIIGILEFLSSEKSFPIVKTSDNNYYLTHNIKKEENRKGAIFLDYRLDIENDKKLIIYGHSSSSLRMPFNFLKNYYNENYLNKNKYIDIVTKVGRKRYEIFSVYVEVLDFSYMKIDFESDKEYLFHIENLKNKSIYDIDTSLKKEDEILILQTCSFDEVYENYKNKYLLIIGRRIL